MPLYPHQQKKIDRNTAQCLIPYGTGTGKTITALELAKKNNVACLIICPKALKKMWQENANKYKQCHAILTKEEFKRDHKTLGKFAGLIVDEAHHFSGRSSELTKSLERYIKTHLPRYRWLLTATPYRSTPWNIQRLATFLGRPMGYQAFVHKYFYEVQMGMRRIQMARPGMEDEIADWVRELADNDVVAMADVVDVPTQTFDTEYFELTEDQEEGIERLEDATFIARFTHTHAIENGILNGDGYSENQSFESNKTKRIIELINSTEKIAIFCRYNAQIEFYKELLKNPLLNKEEKDVFVINGATPDRHAVIGEIEKTEECVVLIQASCSEGYELPSIGTIVFASLSWSYLDLVQAQGRFLRINKLKENKFIFLVVKDGYDNDIYDCIMKKQSFDIAIYEREI